MEWKPIAKAPRDAMLLRKRRAVGAWKHKAYGWVWGPLNYRPDKHYENGGYFIAAGGEPTHFLYLPSPEGR